MNRPRFAWCAWSLAILIMAFSGEAQSRLASDFEIAQMQKQLAQSKGFEAQLSGRLNLGDVRAARKESDLARAEYTEALALAERERLDARRDANLTRYANATSYAALAHARLGHETSAFSLLEEALRYASDDAETWNLYASAMRTLGHAPKAIAAAENAVANAVKPLDRAIYQYALATALIEARRPDEAETLLRGVTGDLHADGFDTLRRQAARAESFEVYSSARGDVAAYVSLLNRAQLRLGILLETRGDLDGARQQYRRVLDARSDDAQALTALARLTSDPRQRAGLYARAFDANPFSPDLIRAYRALPREERADAGEGPGHEVRRALDQLDRGDRRAARATVQSLLVKFPGNDTVLQLLAEAELSGMFVLPSETPTAGELRRLLESFERLTSDQRAALDTAVFQSVVLFDGPAGSTFAGGVIDGVPFRFSDAVIFNGTFDPNARLTFRILGVTRRGDTDALLLEPLGLEAAQ